MASSSGASKAIGVGGRIGVGTSLGGGAMSAMATSGEKKRMHVVVREGSGRTLKSTRVADRRAIQKLDRHDAAIRKSVYEQFGDEGIHLYKMSNYHLRHLTRMIRSAEQRIIRQSRAPSGYVEFATCKRPVLVSGESCITTATAIAKAWRELPEAEKQAYTSRAKAESDRLRERAPPKMRVLNAYTLFIRERRLTGDVVPYELASEWKSMPGEQRDEWKAKERQHRIDYLVAMKQYSEQADSCMGRPHDTESKKSHSQESSGKTAMSKKRSRPSPSDLLSTHASSDSSSSASSSSSSAPASTSPKTTSASESSTTTGTGSMAEYDERRKRALQYQNPNNECPICMDQVSDMAVSCCWTRMCHDCVGVLRARKTGTCPICRQLLADFVAEMIVLETEPGSSGKEEAEEAEEEKAEERKEDTRIKTSTET
jgi:hypothetical protein